MVEIYKNHSGRPLPAKGQVLRESMVSLDLGRALVHGAPRRVAHDPFQQVRGADRALTAITGRVQEHRRSGERNR